MYGVVMPPGPPPPADGAGSQHGGAVGAVCGAAALQRPAWSGGVVGLVSLTKKVSCADSLPVQASHGVCVCVCVCDRKSVSSDEVTHRGPLVAGARLPRSVVRDTTLYIVQCQYNICVCGAS